VIVIALLCISNEVSHADLKVPTIREEITKFSVKYRDKVITHPNETAHTHYLKKKSLED
jgi:hypothetical protein